MGINYKASFEQSYLPLVMIADHYIIVAASDSYLEETKTIRDEIIGKKIYEIFPNNQGDSSGNSQAIICSSIDCAMKNKTSHTASVIQYSKPKLSSQGEGETIKYLSFCHSPVLDEFNEVECIIQRLEDVTQHQKLKEESETDKKLISLLRDSEKRYTMLLMKSPFAFAVFKGQEMIVTQANDSIKKLWGKSCQIEGRPLFDILSELKDSAFPGLIKGVYDTGIPFYGDEVLTQLYRGDKKEDFYYNFIYQPYLEADETISGVTVIAYEVTAQVTLKKNVAEQLEVKENTLKKIEATNKRFYMMLMKSPFAFSIMKGENQVVTLANDLIKDFWGKGEFIEGKPLLEILPELKNQIFPAMISQVYNTGIPVYANEVLALVEHNGVILNRYFNVVFQTHLEADESISGVITIAYEVTEMVLARKKIEESEGRFQAAVAAIQGTLWTTNSKGEVDDIQPSWASLTSQSYDEYKGYGWSNAIHPEDVAQTLEIWVNAVETKKRVSYEHRLKLKDGSWGQFSISAIPLLNADGVVLEWVSVHTDITKQRRAEELIRQNEKKFRLLVDCMPQKISTSGSQGNDTFFNQQWLDETGLSAEELLKGKWENTIYPADLESVRQTWQRCLLSGDIFDIECRILNKKDGYRWNLSRSVPIKNENGQISMWIGSNTDIHEQKEQKKILEKAVVERTKELEKANRTLMNQNEVIEERSSDLILLSANLKAQQKELSIANKLLVIQDLQLKTVNQQLSNLNQGLEERVKRRTKALVESENKFHTMMDTLPQIAWTNTIELKIKFFNERWYEYTGLEFKRAHLNEWKKAIHPEDLPYALDKFRVISNTRKGGDFQTRIKAVTGHYRWHLIRLMPITVEPGRKQLWIGTATDIQEIKALQQHKDDFISIASHELKTPVTSLKLSLQLLNNMNGNLSEPLAKKLIEKSNSSLDKFISLINDLLNASKANERQLHLNKSMFNLAEVIKDSCHYAAADGVTIIIEGDLALQVYADEPRIEQIVINLVNNAIKYAVKSKEIKIDIKRLEGSVKVSVIDKGEGIPSEKVPFLFERYYQVTSAGPQYAGLGLGLYICSQIIKQHKGQIGVDSKLGEGSVFWFTLPL